MSEASVTTLKLRDGSHMPLHSTRTATLPIATRRNVRWYTTHAPFVDDNPIHRDPKAARDMFGKKYKIPRRQVVCPGAVSIGQATSGALHILGDVVVRLLERVKFRHPIFTGEAVVANIVFVNAKCRLGVWEARFDIECHVVGDELRRPALIAAFNVVLPPGMVV